MRDRLVMVGTGMRVHRNRHRPIHPSMRASLRALIRSSAPLLVAVVSLATPVSGVADEAAAYESLEDLRLFYSAEQRARIDPALSTVPVVPAKAARPVLPRIGAEQVGEPRPVNASPSPPSGLATVRGRRGLQRIAAGVPLRTVTP